MNKKILTIINEEIRNVFAINESIDITIDNYDYESLPQNIFDVTHIIKTNVINQMYSKMSSEQQNHFRQNRRIDTVAPDGLDAFNNVGTVNFYLNGYPEELLQQTIDDIKSILPKYGVVINNIKREKSNSNIGDVIRININIPETKIAPSMNLANDNAIKLLQLLGFEPNVNSNDNDTLKLNTTNFYTKIPVDELNKRIQRALYYLDELDLPKNKYTSDTKTNTKTYHRNLTKEDYLNYLTRLKEMTDYAKKFGYPKIAIG